MFFCANMVVAKLREAANVCHLFIKKEMHSKWKNFNEFK